MNYVLRYSNREDTYNHKDNHGKWAKIDPNSGGYAYAVDDVLKAEIFQTLEDAQKYKRHFPFFDIYSIQVWTEPVRGEGAA